MATTKLTINYLLKLLLLVGCAMLPSEVNASGYEGFGENTFAPEYHVPQADIADYASGKLGVVPSTYWRIYQFLAYRALTGQALSKDEVASLNIQGWQVGTSHRNWDYAYNTKVNGVGNWLAARQLIEGTPEIKGLRIERDAGHYTSYVNCTADAFNLAASTLKARLEQYGHDLTSDWLLGQDAVFANCAEQRNTTLKDFSFKGLSFEEQVKNSATNQPPELAKNAPKWLVYDREYQAAAAEFYAARFEKARTLFQTIAKNKQSPWQPLGDYLAARCLIRQATLELSPLEKVKEDNSRNSALIQAKKELIAASKTYPPAKQLITFIDAQLNPDERLQSLGKILATSKIGSETPQLLTDYLLLLDKTDTLKMRNANDSLTQWIGHTQNSNDEYDVTDKNPSLINQRQLGMTIARASWLIEQHQPLKNGLWLLPLVTHAKAHELNNQDLKAINAIPETSPAYQTLQYHLARIAIAENRLNDADTIVTKILAEYTPSMSKANHNRWLTLKVISAKTQAEFLQALPRQYAEVVRAVPIPNETSAPPVPSIAFDTDYQQYLFHNFTLGDLNGLLANKDFPAQYDNKTLKETMWTRAIILEDFDTAKALTDSLMVGRDSTKALFDRFKNAQTNEDKHLAAMLILTNVPELSLYGYGVTESWRNDYSCINAAENCQPKVLNFMQPAAIRAAKIEQQKLEDYSIANNYIAPALLAWAKQKPKDPEAPKALHYFIYGSKYGRNIDTKLSREAFQLLHTYYPNSEWSIKTKYYY
jgi:hypothetical protein